MTLLADENFPLDAVEALRAAGHDVAWVRTDDPGSPDPAVLARAVADRRVLLTFDKDFGELAYRAGLPAGCGVMLFRLASTSSAASAAAVVESVGGRNDWAGQFSVVEPGRVRVKPLPPAG